MDANQVNQAEKSSGASPQFKIRIADNYHQLIKQAADLETAGNVSAFIKQAAIKAARQVVHPHEAKSTLAS